MSETLNRRQFLRAAGGVTILVLTVFDLDGRTQTMTQIDESGREIDRIKVTKS